MTRPVWFRRFGADSSISPNRKPRFGKFFLVPSVWQGWALLLAVILAIVLAGVAVPPYFANPETGQAPLWLNLLILIVGIAAFIALASAFAGDAPTQEPKDKNDAQDR